MSSNPNSNKDNHVHLNEVHGAYTKGTAQVEITMTDKFSPAEMSAIRECRRESFWYRSVPIGGIFGGLAYAAIKKGYTASSSRWGVWPKVLIMGTLGYFIGKRSYRRHFSEKIMRLPDYSSPIARQVRDLEARGQGKGQVKLDMIYGGRVAVISNSTKIRPDGSR